MEFWKLLVGLQGKVQKTLGQKKPFTVSLVNSAHVIVFPHVSHIPRTIPIKAIEGAYIKLKANGRITRVEIEAEFSPAQPSICSCYLSIFARC